MDVTADGVSQNLFSQADWARDEHILPLKGAEVICTGPEEAPENHSIPQPSTR